MEMAPPPMPMGPGADANMAAMNPPAAPEPVPQAPVAPMKPGKPLTVKQEAAQAQGLTDQGMAMQQQGYAEEERGMEAMADVDARRFDAEAEMLAQRQQAAAELKQKHEGERIQAEEEKRTLGNGIAQAVDARKSWRMDRGRLLKQMDGGDKALGALSILLGAFGQHQTKSASNPAMDMLMKSIDQDAQDQMQEYDQLGENAAEAKSSYKEYMAQLKDRDAAAAATKAELYQGYAEKIEMMGARSSSERVKANAVVISGQFKQKASQAILQGADSAHQRVQQRRQLAAQYSAQAKQDRQWRAEFDEGKRRYDLESQAKEKAALAAGNPAEAARIKEERSLGIGDLTGAPIKNKDGTSFLARSPESAIEIAKQTSATYGIATLASQLEDGYRKHGAEFTKTEAYRQLKSTHAQMQIELKEAFKLGVLAGPDLELINNAIGTSDPIELRGYTKALRGLADNSVTRLETRMRADGFTGKLNVPTASSMAAAQPSENSEEAKAIGALSSPQVNKYVGYKPGQPKPEEKPLRFSEPARPGKEFYSEIGFSGSEAAALGSLRDRGAKAEAKAMADSLRGVTGKSKIVAQLDAIARM